MTQRETLLKCHQYTKGIGDSYLQQTEQNAYKWKDEEQNESNEYISKQRTTHRQEDKTQTMHTNSKTLSETSERQTDGYY